MRAQLVSELIKEVLGPRGGPNEKMENDPKSEFLTGLLSPKMSEEPEEEVENEELVGESELHEEDQTEPEIISEFDPVLNPKDRPHSMGISFILKGMGNSPKFSVCLTWARYQKEGEFWERIPSYCILENIEGNESKKIPIDNDGKTTDSESDAVVSLNFKSSKVGENRHISIYLVNEIQETEKWMKTENCIFQPQIRIKVSEDTHLVPAILELSDDRINDPTLEFLYSKRPLVARGHMCSAIWKDIDPERECKDCEKSRDGLLGFYWVDNEIIPRDKRVEFANPDARTDFIPMYSVSAPDLSWDAEKGNPPELNSEKLADCFDPEELARKLAPLSEGYERWIKRLEKSSDPNTKYEKIKQQIIKNCQNRLRLIKKGVNFLSEDMDARLAFCFANKAMSLQYKWSRKDKSTSLNWYPFQLAFLVSVIESIANPESEERSMCDLLWIPTGGGKTEAYLAVAAFTMAHRRLKALKRKVGDRTGGGVSVISRYTLRLLTIQQFRRALRVVTACEYLRTTGMSGDLPVGWRPKGLEDTTDFIWGSKRFSIGLWVGGNVAPNKMLSQEWRDSKRFHQKYNAIDILKGEDGKGEPAQITNCPVCDAVLSVPKKGGLEKNTNHEIHFLVESKDSVEEIFEDPTKLNTENIIVSALSIAPSRSKGVSTVSISLENRKVLLPEDVEKLWSEIKSYLANNKIKVKLSSASAFNPGYFIRRAYPYGKERTRKDIGFEIFCTNPKCDLNKNVLWGEGVPIDHPETLSYFQYSNSGRTIRLSDGMKFRHVPEISRYVEKVPMEFISTRIPIPAVTVDDAVYNDPPTMLVSTVDKFARLPFEPKCGAIFGNIEFYNPKFGYYRPHFSTFKKYNTKKETHPPGEKEKVPFFEPPDLIIQDELHLIEGPLGSIVGIYETAIDFLTSSDGVPAKYITSTATAKHAATQVSALFGKELLQFPPSGLDIDDSFFIRSKETHPLDESKPGRLYLGVCAPGRGPLTPVKNMWARLLQTTYQLKELRGEEADPFLTLVGYFNAIRELAGARNLYNEDIPERLYLIGGENPRSITDDMERVVELSSRIESTDLPSKLNLLRRKDSLACDALFTTSMFGTGIDISRLSLMVVHGQPKTSSAYIQSTGRVGRKTGGLVISFYRSTRPRDLSHYEYFTGYHRALYKFVEPVSVAPLSRGALERAAGPVMVGILRNMKTPVIPWSLEDSARKMFSHRNSPDLKKVIRAFEVKAGRQPQELKHLSSDVLEYIKAGLDTWKRVAADNDDLKYVEYFRTKNPVVLGDPLHAHAGQPCVFSNSPQSMRDVEETIKFQSSDFEGRWGS